MATYLVRRFLLALLTIWVVSIMSFIIIQIPPGDTADRMIEDLVTFRGYMTPEQADELRHQMGIDLPLHRRYVFWMRNLMRGELGLSFGMVPGYLFGIPVADLIEGRILMTIVLSGFTIIFTWTLAIPIGIYSAVRQHSVGDYTFTFLGFTGLAVPDFLLGLVLMYLALAYLDQSVGGLLSSEQLLKPWSLAKVWDLINHLWIPAVVLGTSGTASLIRIMRNNLLDELSKPYVVTAKAKGMSPWRATIKYPVRIALNPLVSTAGYLLPALVGGSVIVSVVLGLPTLGPMLLQSYNSQDVHSGAFILLMLGTLTVIGTFLSDILLAVVDPRIKFGSV